MKNIFKVNFLVYIFAFISVLIGSFKIFLIITYLIIIHELGHFIMAKISNIETDKIYIYPLGGISKFNMDLNINPIKEFLILINGPIFQIIGCLILMKLLPENKELIRLYSNGILLFNLLPIYPLDGGKLMNLLFNNIFPYKTSLKISLTISYLVVLIIFIIENINLNIILLVIVSLILITKEKNKINHTYNKFILERYLNNYNFKDGKIITNINEFYRNKKHLIKEDTNYYLEKEYLAKKYQKIHKNR